jgi:hypothetical protein
LSPEAVKAENRTVSHFEQTTAYPTILQREEKTCCIAGLPSHNIAYPTASCLTAQDSPGRTLRPPRMPYAYYTSQSHTTDMYKRFTPGTPLSQARLVARRLMLGIEVSSEVARQKVRRPGRLDVSDQVFARNLDVLGLDARCFGDFGGLFREDGLEEGGVDLLARVIGGNGCVPINNLMEDAATAEIARVQLWQWVKYGSKTDSGKKIALRGEFASWLTELHDSRLDVAPDTALGDLALALGVVDLLVGDRDVLSSDVVLVGSLHVVVEYLHGDGNETP